MIDDRTRKAIEAADTDELLRIIDGHCQARSWEELYRLRAHCQEAVTRGKQLWAVDEHIRYRLALEAPALHAGPAVTEGRARFTLGPLPEVTASTHTWSELDPHLEPGPERAMTAHERVICGEDLTGAEVDPLVLELPLRLEPWEPRYPVASYHSDRAEFPAPPVPELEPRALPASFETLDDPESVDALSGLVTPWVEQSNGRLEVAAVVGDALAAIATTGLDRALVAEVDPTTALAWMGWAAASGGAHGRRRGAAAGRFGAWWAAATLAGLDWPVVPEEMGECLADLRWWLWSDQSSTGWTLRLAIEDEGIAWMIAATDEKITE